MDKQALQQERLNCELRRKQDSMYTTMLLTFGIVSILIASVLLILSGLTTDYQVFATYIVGFFLLIAGGVWHVKNDLDIKRIDEKIAILESEEIASQRIGGTN